MSFKFVTGTLDVLVHSAGIVVNGSTIDLSISEYDRCMNINARSAFIFTKECLPHLSKTKGNIVHVSSVTGMLAVVLRQFPALQNDTIAYGIYFILATYFQFVQFFMYAYSIFSSYYDFRTPCLS